MNTDLQKKAFWAAYRESAIDLCEFQEMEYTEENIETVTMATWEMEFLTGFLFFSENGEQICLKKLFLK